MNTFIIIITYNAMQWLSQCLESTKSYQVIIVDNNSKDGTVEFIKENYPHIVLLEQKKNLGFGQGNNLGISYALQHEADYVFLLNQDAYLQEQCLETLIAVHQQNPVFGILSPIHFNGIGDQLDSTFSEYLNRYDLYNRILADLIQKQPQKIYPIPFVNGAAWLLPAEVLKAVGGFDTLFFHYGEDRNYCQRILFHDFKIGIVPGASVKHDRQNRNEKEIKKYTAEYYSQYERLLKVEWGDINKPHFEQDFKKKKKYLSKKCIYYLLALKFTQANDIFRKKKIMDRLEKMLIMSREKNKLKQIEF